MTPRLMNWSCPRGPANLKKTVRRLEKTFLDVKGPLGSARATGPLAAARPERTVPSVMPTDAEICWCNAVWELPTPPPVLADPLAARHTSAFDRANRGDRRQKTPSRADLRGLVLLLMKSAHGGADLVEVRPLLGRAQQFLAEHEGLLGIRLAWLGWEAVNRLADGDVLALARARDRLLERLYLAGLSADLDLPGFLRFGGVNASTRFHQVREQMLRMHPMVHRWIAEGYITSPGTAAYVDLLFAFGMARLGEKNQCRKLIEEAPKHLAARDEVHRWLIQAFEFRILEAQEGRAGVQRLPADLLDRLESMEVLARYKIDRLREHRASSSLTNRSTPIATGTVDTPMI